MIDFIHENIVFIASVSLIGAGLLVASFQQQSANTSAIPTQETVSPLSPVAGTPGVDSQQFVPVAASPSAPAPTTTKTITKPAIRGIQDDEEFDD
ncbi:MAG: hypothetical protein WCS97_03215 [Candidatus Paceibacterota bacterium]|jgi:hypothetical protein